MIATSFIAISINSLFNALNANPMNLENHSEVSRFLGWVNETEGALTARRCQEEIQSLILANQRDLAQPLELLWRVQDTLHASEIADASEIARSPFDSRVELD